MSGLDLLYGFAVVFAVVGGFELVDRTNFSLIALSARRSPWLTWVGGSLAFLASTLVAVTAGAAFVALLGASRLGLLRAAGGAFLIGYALWYASAPDELEPSYRRESVLGTAFLATFLLELGDTTMILQIVFVASYGAVLVFVAGASALITAAAWGTFLGSRLGARVEPPLMKRIVVVVLVGIGLATILYGLDPGLFAVLG